MPGEERAPTGVIALRPFVIARDLVSSRAFYEELGFTARVLKAEPWGLTVAYVFDPSGVLWHVASA